MICQINHISTDIIQQRPFTNYMDQGEWNWLANHKIARFTRQVYHLHTEAVDRKDMVDIRRCELEDELSFVRERSRGLLDAAQDALNIMTDILEPSFRAEYDRALRVCEVSLEDQRSAVSDKRHRLESDLFTSKQLIHKSLSEIRLLRDAHSVTIADLSREMTGKSASVVSAASERNKRRLCERVSAANAEFNRQVVEQAKREDKLKASHLANLDFARASLANEQAVLVSEMEAERRRLAGQLADLEGERDKLLGMIETVKVKATGSVKEIEWECETAARKVHDVQSGQSREVGTARKKLDEIRHAQRETCEVVLAEIDDARKNAEDERVKLEEATMRENNEHEERMKELGGAVGDEERERTRRMEEIGSKNEEEMSRLRKKHDKFVEDAKKRENEVRLEMSELLKRHEVEVQTVKTEMFKEREKFESGLAAIKKKHTQEVERVRLDHMHKIALLKEELSRTSAASTDSRAQRIDAIVAVQREIADIERKSAADQDERRARFKMEIEKLQNEQRLAIAATTKEQQMNMNEIEVTKERRITKRMGEHEERMKMLDEASTAKIEQECDVLGKELSEQNRSELSRVKRAWEQKLADITAQITAKRNARDQGETSLQDGIHQRQQTVNEHRETVARLKREWEVERASINDEFSGKLTSLQTSNAEWEKRVIADGESEKARYSREMAEKRDQLGKVKDSKKSVVQELTKQSASLDAKQTQEITVMNEEITKAVNARDARLAILEDQISELEHALEVDLKTMQIEHEAILSEQERAYDDERYRNESEITRKGQELVNKETRNQSQLTILQAQVGDEQQRYRKELFLLKQSQEDDLEEMTADNEQEARDMSDGVSTLRQQVENERVEQEHALSEISNDQNVKLEKMKMQYESERSSLSETCVLSEAAKTAAIAEIDRDADVWHDKFNGRGIRPEDAEIVQRLNDSIRDRVDALEAVTRELSRYQSEVLNRETTFNKVFSNRPRVQVLSALERRVKRDRISTTATTVSSGRLPRIDKP